jgi:acetyltransferase-like isoleucine patch superfamily enzyme
MTIITTRLLRYLSIRNLASHSIDIYIRLVLQPIWRRQGVTLGGGISWLGRPILTLAPKSTMSIGDDCLICSRSEQTALGVNHPVVLRTLRPGAVLSLGRGVRMSGTTVCAAQHVVIGDRCVIGSNVTIADTDFHSLDPQVRSSVDDLAGAGSRPVHIGNDVFIGSGSYILKGATVGDCAVIGAASVVTQAVEAGAIVAGNPARDVRGPSRETRPQGETAAGGKQEVEST